jgi:hypothetical protein
MGAGTYLLKLIFISVPLILIILTIFSIFNLYSSPLVKTSNLQVTESDYSGMNTFFQYRDDSLPIEELGLSQKRYYDAIFGTDAPRKNIFYRNDLAPPDHFNYSKSSASKYFAEHYLLINDQGRGFYQNVLPEFRDKWRYTSEDFKKLDEFYDIVYTNKYLSLYIIN